MYVGHRFPQQISYEKKDDIIQEKMTKAGGKNEEIRKICNFSVFVGWIIQ
jgi:hypothetical protein